MKDSSNKKVKAETHPWKCKYCGAINKGTDDKTDQPETYGLVCFEQDGLTIKKEQKHSTCPSNP